MLPEYNSARDQTCNLRKHEFDPPVAHHNDVAFVFHAGQMIESRLERPLPIVERLDTAANGTSVDVHIKDREKYAYLCDVADSLDLHDSPVRGRNNERGISWNF